MLNGASEGPCGPWTASAMEEPARLHPGDSVCASKASAICRWRDAAVVCGYGSALLAKAAAPFAGPVSNADNMR